MPVAQITIIEGRPAEKRAAAMREVAEALSRTLDAPIESVRVIINEVPAFHWSVGGVPKGQPAQD